MSMEVENTTTSTKNIGLRMMLDTMLGKNDAAPFRIGRKAYQSEHSFEGASRASFWQTFDYL